MDAWAPGHRVGRYELICPLGTGGTGEVWEARFHGPGRFTRRVALKLLRTAPDRLRREAWIGGLLRHRHLVDVYEFGEQDGRAFCAMELCDAALSDVGPLSPRAIVDVGLQVCAALGYAHGELGLVHRDLKPSNLFVKDGSLKVGDLGAALAEGVAPSGRVAGTPGFMAPEQRFGAAVDARVDVYGLGMTLAALAGGRSRGAATLDWDAATLEPATSEPTGAPAWLAPVLDRCLADDPAARFAGMAELAEALRGIEAPGPSLAESTRELARGAEPEAAGPRNRFVGRAGWRPRIAEALATEGWVTLVGPPGIGKTRLAAEVADAWTAGPVFRCEVAEVRDRAGVLGAVAAAVGVGSAARSEEEQASTLAHALRSAGRPLVVIDTFEHVVAHVGVLAAVRAAAPSASWLITSLAAPGVPGALLQIPPLDADEAQDLLVTRALERGVDVAGDPALATLVARLDGVPLALELAAGRLGVLSPADVVERLDLSLLRSAEDLPDRQATLTGALDWSWDLLSPAERDVLAQLSVFRGRFALDAAEAVARPIGGAWVVDVIQALVERSLLSVDGDRFGLLGPIRAYAALRLADPGPVRMRHAAWFGRVGESWSADLATWTGVPLRVGQLPDLEAACRWASAAGRLDLAVGALRGVWSLRDLVGPFGAAATLAGEVVEAAGAAADPAGLALAYDVWGRALHRLGRLTEARQRLERALQLAAPLGDPALVARLRLTEAMILTDAGEAEAALAVGRELLAGPGLADDALAASTLGVVGIALLRLGRLAEACEAQERAGALWRRIGAEARVGVSLSNVGLVLSQLGRLDDGARALEEAQAIHLRVGNRRSAANALANLANIAREQARFETARRSYEEAIGLFAELGERHVEGLYRGNLALLLKSLGQHAASRAELLLAVELTEGSPRSHAFARVHLAEADAWAGDLVAARAGLTAALAAHQQVGDAVWIAVARGYLASIDAREGRVEDAIRTLRESVAALAHRPAAAGELSVRLGHLRLAHGDPGGLDDYDRAIALFREGGWKLDLAEALVARARARIARGEPAGQDLAEARALVAQLHLPDEADVVRALTDLAPE